MKTLQLHTTLHCQNCVSKIAPLLDKQEKIEKWNIDFSQQKHLSIEGEVTQEEVNKLLQQEGYAIKGVDKQSNFWADKVKWKRASFNTLNCLIGCSIGDFGTIIFMQTYYPETNIFLIMGLAMAMGLLTSITLETIILKVRESFAWKKALTTAFNMSFISMLAMEFSENATDYFLTGGNVPTSEPFYWIALGIALVMGFLVPLPYNYYKLKKHNIACH